MLVHCCKEHEQGSGQIWLDSVSCSGEESELAECHHENWGVNDCGHYEDVGIICCKSSAIMCHLLQTVCFLTKLVLLTVALLKSASINIVCFY